MRLEIVSTKFQPFAHTSGPHKARLMLVGEAWGEQEALAGKPFVGSSGQELTRMLRDAGIDRDECLLTNVFADRPPDNNLDHWSLSKPELPEDYNHAPLRQGKYLAPQHLPHVQRLRAEIEACQPNILVPLGNTACWAVLGSARISSIRGVATECKLVPGIKVVPTYHPSAVLRQWALRTIVVMDLIKALRESTFPDIRRPERSPMVSPTAGDLIEWCKLPIHTLAVDIETCFRQIKMIGFARSASDALVIPFVDFSKPGYAYWPTLETELFAWGVVKGLLERPCPKIFQNGLYDLQYILRMGFRPVNCQDDTMLLHHSLYPEMQKGLGFLGSIYTNESSWKLLREADTNKRDE